jgi:hypothetical protein
MKTYVIGQQLVHTATFTDDADALVDPATVTFQLRTPAGAETSYTYAAGQVTKVSTGVFKFTAPAFTTAGQHVVRVKSTTPATARESTVTVSRSAFDTP